MRPKSPTPMQAVWTKLPTDIVADIIQCTNDMDMLVTWCAATQGVSRLIHVALRKRWDTLRVDELDLVPAPLTSDATDAQEMETRWAHVGLYSRNQRSVTEVARAFNDGTKDGVCPAKYVRELILDFRMRHFWGYNFRSHFGGDGDQYLPSTEPLGHSLDLLHLSLVNVRHVQTMGLTPRIVFDMITKLPSAPQLQILQLRTQKGSGTFSRNTRAVQRQFLDDDSDEGRRAPIASMQCLRLSKLRRLKELRQLEIHRLRGDEPEQLAVVIPKLHQLEDLVIADGDDHGEMQSIRKLCPMHRLLGKMFKRDPRNPGPASLGATTMSSFDPPKSLSFPASLKSLALIDTSRTR